MIRSRSTASLTKTNLRKGGRGFSLFELMMVIAVCGILAAIGTASFRYVTTANRAAMEINSVLGDLQFARSEALKRGQFVTVCPVNASTTCVASNSWSTGWQVFVDVNGDHTYDSVTDALLRTGPSLNKMVPNGADTMVGSAATLQYIMFNREGFADTGTSTPAAWSSLTLDSTPSNANLRRCLAISATGGMTVIRGGATAPLPC